LTIIGQHKAIVYGQTIYYTVKRSPKAKYVRLEVRPETGLTVVIPRSYKPEQVPALLKEKERWISGKLAKYARVQQSGITKSLENGDTVPYLGRDMKVVVRQSEGKLERVNLERNRLIVDLGAGDNGLNPLLEQWYRMQAAELIEEKVNKMSSLMGLKYGRLTIRGQKTRWGSCSHKGNLNFNWRLMMVPEPVIDYIIIHELAHLKEMNHTKRFWQLVEQYCPKWRNHKKWLRDHTMELNAKLTS